MVTCGCVSLVSAWPFTRGWLCCVCRKGIQNQACKDRVVRMVALSMQDIRFNHPLGEACATDRLKLCGTVPPGSAMVIRCLREK